MATGKAADSKREEFRRYLERTGVMDALTKALVLLYEEQDKPDDALGYIKGQLGGGSGDDKNTKLEQENADLRAQLAHLMGGEGKPSVLHFRLSRSFLELFSYVA
ncbi:hypothetical protein R5R35_001140 [Gryllus longicercus]|uniref:c-Myc-binding protein n=1 Tax=Gryllus longicercus TaxID=2509291 RepID=A0AAN9VWL7_9ORTH